MNDSSAAKSIYEQLPFSMKVENFGGNEKIFYPKKLSTANTPKADAKKGTLAYYEPWGDVVMYYRDFGTARGLYDLGNAVSGKDDIQALSGKITVDKAE